MAGSDDGSFNGFEIFVFVFSIAIFTTMSAVNLIWSFGLGQWISYEMTYLYKFQSFLLTASGILLMGIVVALLLASYAVDSYERKKFKLYYIAMTAIVVVLVVLVAPLSGVAAFSDVNVETKLEIELESELTMNSSDSNILSMAYTKFGCCGIVTEKSGVCPQTIPPVFLDYNDSIWAPCSKGSRLCSTGCLNSILKTFVEPYKNVGRVIGFATFIAAIVNLILIILSLISEKVFYRKKRLEDREREQGGPSTGRRRTAQNRARHGPGMTTRLSWDDTLVPTDHKHLAML